MTREQYQATSCKNVPAGKRQRARLALLSVIVTGSSAVNAAESYTIQIGAIEVPSTEFSAAARTIGAIYNTQRDNGLVAISVGRFASSDSARKALAQLTAEYPDAYVRKANPGARPQESTTRTADIATIPMKANPLKTKPAAQPEPAPAHQLGSEFGPELEPKSGPEPEQTTAVETAAADEPAASPVFPHIPTAPVTTAQEDSSTGSPASAITNRSTQLPSTDTRTSLRSDARTTAGPAASAAIAGAAAGTSASSTTAGSQSAISTPAELSQPLPPAPALRPGTAYPAAAPASPAQVSAPVTSSRAAASTAFEAPNSRRQTPRARPVDPVADAKVLATLSLEEQRKVVYLDGVLHMKEGERFISLEQYRARNR